MANPVSSGPESSGGTTRCAVRGHLNALGSPRRESFVRRASSGWSAAPCESGFAGYRDSVPPPRDRRTAARVAWRHGEIWRCAPGGSCSSTRIRTTRLIGTARRWRNTAVAAHVTLVTCTLGEEGEVLRCAPGLCAAGRPTRWLPRGRVGAGVRRAGGHRPPLPRWRRVASGLRDDGHPANDPRRAFWRADLVVAASDLVT